MKDFGVLEWCLVIIFVIGIVMGAWWLLWMLYLFVADSFWPGHGAISEPSYWQFAAAWTLLVLVARLFKSKSGGSNE